MPDRTITAAPYGPEELADLKDLIDQLGMKALNPQVAARLYVTCRNLLDVVERQRAALTNT